MNSRFFTIPTIIAFLAIAGCVTFLIAVQEWAKNLPERAGHAPDQNPMLQLQLRYLAGAGQFVPHDALRQAEVLAGQIETPEEARGVAALFSYLGDTERAVELMTRKGGNTELDDAVRQAIADPDSLSEDQQAFIQVEMGWSGQLLLARSLPLVEEAVRESSMRMVIGTISILAIGFLAGMTGLVLLVVAGILLSDRKLKLRFSPSENGGLYVQGFALYLLSMTAGLILVNLVGGSHIVWNLVAIAGATLIGLVWPVVRGVPFSQVRRELGIHWGEGLRKEVTAGVAGYFAMIPLMVLGIAITAVLQAIFSHASGEAAEPISHPVSEMLEKAGLPGVVMIFLLAAVAAPLAEELMFRGALFRGLRTKLNAVFSAFLMAFVFAAVHPQGLFAIPALMAMGIGFGALREWRDSILAPTVMHGVHNGTILAFTLLVTN